VVARHEAHNNLSVIIPAAAWQGERQSIVAQGRQSSLASLVARSCTAPRRPCLILSYDGIRSKKTFPRTSLPSPVRMMMKLFLVRSLIFDLNHVDLSCNMRPERSTAAAVFPLALRASPSPPPPLA
jgi:hypothetical protein